MSSYDFSSDTRSLYIHWPFCPYRCSFCPFVTVVGHEAYMERYHAALTKEISRDAALFQHKYPLETIYFGGGTPSTYPDNLLLDTFAILRKSYEIHDKTEITMEVNPGTVRNEQLALWKKLGVTRVSIGVQSLNTRLLQNLNRHQTVEDVTYAVNNAVAYIDMVSVDLIVGLPGVSREEWEHLVESVVSWPIKHVSVYFLTIHENTLLYHRIRHRKIVLPHDDDVVDMYIWTVNMLQKHGFEQYEISNFAKRGAESRHNQVYWQRKPYKGFGLGACSFDGHSRMQNEKIFMKYIESIENDQDSAVFFETLTQDNICLERIMLALRTRDGLSYDALVDGLNDKQSQQLLQEIQSLRETGKLTFQHNRLTLTAAGLAIEQDVAARLLRYL